MTNLDKNRKSSYTPTPFYGGIEAREIEKQDEEYLLSLLEDRKKEKQKELRMQELRAQKEAEELEKALLNSRR